MGVREAVSLQRAEHALVEKLSMAKRMPAPAAISTDREMIYILLVRVQISRKECMSIAPCAIRALQSTTVSFHITCSPNIPKLH